MVHSFEFSMDGFLYYQGGCETREEARSKLEKISKSHCKYDNLAVGKIFKAESGEFSVLEKYEISLRNEKLIMKSLN